MRQREIEGVQPLIAVIARAKSERLGLQPNRATVAIVSGMGNTVAHRTCPEKLAGKLSELENYLKQHRIKRLQVFTIT